MVRILTLFALAFACTVQAQNVLQLNSTTMAMYSEAEGPDRAGNLAGLIEVWRKLAKSGHPVAQYELAAALLRAPARREDAQEALDLLQAAADRGFLRANAFLGVIYRDGRAPFIPADPARALPLLRAAAQAGLPPAMVHLGRAYAAGDGVAKDPKEAFAWFQRAARADHPFGHFAVGAAYEAGIGVPADKEKARDSYNIALERAHWFRSRQGVPYAFQPLFDRWIADTRAALAGLDGAPLPQLAAATLALAAPTASPAAPQPDALAAERRKLQEMEARVQADRKVIEELSRLAEERKRLAIEQAKLAEERRKLEAENARLEDERRKFTAAAAATSAQRAEAERRRVDEEAAARRQLEQRQQAEAAARARAEQERVADEARIAEERRRLAADQARVAEERRNIAELEAAARAQAQAQAQVQPRAVAEPTAAPKPAAPRARSDSDFAATFGSFVRGLSSAAQVVGGVRAAVGGVRARDESQVSQGVNTITSALGIGGGENTGSTGGSVGGGGLPQGGAPVVGGASSGNCDAAAREFDVMYGPTAQAKTQAVRNSNIPTQSRAVIEILNEQIRYLERVCQGRRELADLKRTRESTWTTCRKVATIPSDCGLGPQP